MAQEARVDTGVAQGQGFAVHSDGTVLQRPNDIVSGVHQGVHIGTMLPAHLVEGGDAHFQRRVARTGAHAGQGGINTVTAFFYRHDGVGHTEGQVVVGVDAGFGFRLEHIFQGPEAVADVVHVHGTAGVNDIEAGGAVVFHQLGLFRQPLWGLHVAHHQEAHGVHAQLSGMLDVLPGDIRLGAVGGHSYDACASAVGIVQVVDGADAGQQQGGDFGVFGDFGDRFDPLQVGVGAEAVVEAGALQAIAVGHFNTVDLGLVQGPCNVLHVLDGVLVADGVAAVAQCHVGDVEFLAGIKGHDLFLLS